MTRTMTASELKAKLLAVLDDVAAGAEVEVTKRGRAVARLVPIGGQQNLRGRYAGVAATAADDDALFSTGEGWDLE